MKKLFAAVASAALVGTVFAQTGAPASATQPQAGATKGQVKVMKEESATQGKADNKNKMGVSEQGDVGKAQGSGHKEKADVKAGAHKSAVKGTPHKASETKAVHSETGKAKVDDANHAKAKADIAKPSAKADATKAAASANGDMTKKP
ncbi:hypothetical protein [Cupriavidus pinatubonensis]|uniref:hypothetical protein n=1 Tax=Cupriavidus pinatubonensis TaxID=248026 RepID=UPI003605B6E4